jgi:hypothetical protein
VSYESLVVSVVLMAIPMDVVYLIVVLICISFN